MRHRTIWYMYHPVQEGAMQMSQLRVQAEGTTRADVETVWSLVADANSYPQWGPWNDGGYRPPGAGPSREGSIQWFRYGRRTVSVEEVLEVDPPRRLVYRVVSGLPVRNYRAEVTVTLAPAGGTTIHWAATWDNTMLGRVVYRRLQQIYPQIVQALVAEADRRQATARMVRSDRSS
jgi:uncharacterized protein YndB with AHSA1/START domain